MPRDPLRSWAPCVLLLAAALGGCGGDEEPPPPVTAPVGHSTVETAGDGGADPGAEAGRQGDGAAPDARESEPDGSAEADAPGGCRYDAPPGRLGNDAVTIELSGTNCEQGRRLALAAAVGQPAGANIPVRRDGFKCEPSTRERGANVDYSCSKGSEAASFRIEWTAEP